MDNKLLRMNHKLLTDLPTAIIITILHRLPPKTIISCKCVCKSLLNLLETPDFVKFHLSKSIPGLIVCDDEKVVLYSFETFESEDELNLEKHELRYVPVTELSCSAFISKADETGIEGSANGLLFLRNLGRPHNSLYICNPITREYINLPHPEEEIVYTPYVSTAYGFGVSKMNDQYKVVRILQETGNPLSSSKTECRVYTLGSGSWNSVPPDCYQLHASRSNGAFLYGNLHWLVTDLKGSLLISCFDLETERFGQAFSTPCFLPEIKIFLGDVAVLEGRLCLCEYTLENEIVVWILKGYGVEDSWTKEFVISKLPDHSYAAVNYPIKVFRDGDILILCLDTHLFYYSGRKTKTTPNVNNLDLHMSDYLEARLHVSSFISLKSFEMENVSKF